MSKGFYLRLILGCFLISQGSFGRNIEDSTYTSNKYVEEGIKQLNDLKKFNETNERKGIPQNNIYVFGVTPTDSWLKREKGSEKLITSTQFEFLNNKLVKFNSNSSQPKIYVCLAGGWIVPLKKKIDSKSITLDDLRENATSAGDVDKIVLDEFKKIVEKIFSVGLSGYPEKVGIAVAETGVTFPTTEGHNSKNYFAHGLYLRGGKLGNSDVQSKIKQEVAGKLVRSGAYTILESYINNTTSALVNPLNFNLSIDQLLLTCKTQEAKDFLNTRKDEFSSDEEKKRLAITIANQIDELGSAWYSQYLKLSEPNQDFYYDLKLWGGSIDDYKGYSAALQKFTKNKLYLLGRLREIFNADEMDDFLRRHFKHEDYWALGSTERIHVLKVLSSSSMWGNFLFGYEEKRALWTVQSVSPNDYPLFLEKLRDEKILETLIRRMDDGEIFGEDNLTEFILELSSMTFKSKGLTPGEQLPDPSLSKQTFTWAEPQLSQYLGRFEYKKPEFTDDGKVVIMFRYCKREEFKTTGTGDLTSIAECKEWSEYKSVPVPVFDLITIIPETDLTFLNLCNDGLCAEGITMPAFFFSYLYKKKSTYQTIASIKVGVNVGIMLIGIGELAAAKSAGQAIWASLELSVPVADMIITSEEEVINKMAYGPEFLTAWKVVNTAFNVSSGGRALWMVLKPKQAENFLKAYDQLKSNNDLSKIQTTVSKIDDGVLKIQSELSKYGYKILLNGAVLKSIRLARSVKSTLQKDIFDVLLTKLDNQSHIWLHQNGPPTIQTPKGFLNETGENMYDLTVDSKYYLKYDYSDGRLLMADVDGNYLAFVQDSKPILQPGQQVDVVIENHLKNSAEKLKNLMGVSGSKTIKLLGEDIITSSNKITTILGRFDPDISGLFKEFGDFKNIDLGEVNGGINILNRPKIYEDAFEWWPANNLPWLKRAVDRGDDIYFATLQSKDEIIDVTTGQLKGIYAKELQYLVQRNYKPKNILDEQWILIKSWFDDGAKVGTYTTKIKWGILDVDVRPYEKGFWGKRVTQSDPRVDAYEIKINPNNESFYLPHPDGGYVQYENIINATVQDGKLVMDQSSIYHVLDKPEFLIQSILDQAQRQLNAAKASGYRVEWLVSDEKAVQQLTQYFKDKNIDVTVILFKE